MPSTPHEFKGLLLAAIEDDNPVIFLEHRWLHYVTGAVPTEYYTLPLVGSRIVDDGNLQRGNNATIVATSYMVLEAVRAAKALADVRLSVVEVIRPPGLRPLNVAPIIESVRRTGKLVMCDTGWTRFGVGAEIIASLVEKAFGALRKPVARIGLPDHPTPSSVALAEVYYPDSADIVEAVGKLLRSDVSADCQGFRSCRCCPAGCADRQARSIFQRSVLVRQRD